MFLISKKKRSKSTPQRASNGGELHAGNLHAQEVANTFGVPEDAVIPAPSRFDQGLAMRITRHPRAVCAIAESACTDGRTATANKSARIAVAERRRGC